MEHLLLVYHHEFEHLDFIGGLDFRGTGAIIVRRSGDAGYNLRIENLKYLRIRDNQGARNSDAKDLNGKKCHKSGHTKT